MTDKDTLESLTVSLGPTEALVVGRVTGNFPLVVNAEALPSEPVTDRTRSFCDRPNGELDAEGVAA